MKINIFELLIDYDVITNTKPIIEVNLKKGDFIVAVGSDVYIEIEPDISVNANFNLEFVQLSPAIFKKVENQ